ncbi:MAG: hypothetical protein IPP28_07235 [Xanthomonadales bacterium]|nr:hypothetical protein [Xanthomonadales bacterium]
MHAIVIPVSSSWQAQIARDYAAAELSSEGLPSTPRWRHRRRTMPERVVAEKIKTLARTPSGLQTAMVVTRAATGAIEAVVGDRDPQRPDSIALRWRRARSVRWSSPS